MFKRNCINLFSIMLVTIFSALAASPVFSQATSFTYQGKVTEGGIPANGNYRMIFTLYDSPIVGAGNQIGQPTAEIDAQIINGIFSVQVDFGANVFDGNPRYLEISLKPRSSQDPFTTLSPRQPITATPYAVRSLAATHATTSDTANFATTADDTNKLGNIPAAQYVITTDSRMSDARVPLPGSPNYIQNTINQQTNSNFNITGSGKANIFQAATQFNIGNNRVLSVAGTDNLFLGVFSGIANMDGTKNTFAGQSAGRLNTSGFSNSFFGYRAGEENNTGLANSFFGALAGIKNQTGEDNAFFGGASGFYNLSGKQNSFFGGSSGQKNTTGSENVFNGFFAGSNNTTGSKNVFVGRATGNTNTTEDFNTLLGYAADITAGVTNSTAIGAYAKVTTSDTIVLGTNSMTVNVPGSFKSMGNATFGGTLSATGNAAFGSTLNVTGNATFNATVTGNTVNVTNAYQINGIRFFHTTGTDNVFVGQESGNAIVSGGNSNAFFGSQSGKANTSGANNAFFGYKTGFANTIGKSNSFFGSNAGAANFDGNDNSFFGTNAGMTNTTGDANSFFGHNAGIVNLEGSNNAFFGNASGQSNTSGISNSFFGGNAGLINSIGGFNVFVGRNAGSSNTQGNSNTMIGTSTGLSITTGSNNVFLGYNSGSNSNVSNSVAIGANVKTTSSDQVLIGTATHDVSIPGKTTFGSTVVTSGSLNVGGSFTSTAIATLKNGLTVEAGNVKINSGDLDVTGDIGASNVQTGEVTTNKVSIMNNGTVNTPYLWVTKDLKLSAFLPSGGESDFICQDENNYTLKLCFADLRTIKNATNFSGGLNIIKNLRPLTFNTDNNVQSIGLGFVNANEANSLFAKRDSSGAITSVRYQQVITALVSAAQEQQTQIEQQQTLNQKLQEQIKVQQQQLDALKALICAGNTNAAICQK